MYSGNNADIPLTPIVPAGNQAKSQLFILTSREFHQPVNSHFRINYGAHRSERRYQAELICDESKIYAPPVYDSVLPVG